MSLFCLVVCLEADVSPSSGIRVPVCVCFGSDADVSPVIGIRAPRLPLSLFVLCACQPSYECSDSPSSEEIRMHRMRYPSEHVSFPQSELLRL